MELELEDKVVVITGSSRGIGRELVKKFSDAHAKIVINYNKSEREAKTLYESLLLKKTDCIMVKADVSKLNEVIYLKEVVMAHYGKVDILINNAGICEDNSIQQLTEEQWKNVLDVNLSGVYYCSKVFAEEMIKQKSGKIINVSSIKGQEGCPEQTNYAASKAGVIGFSKALAKELGRFDIAVNCVCPGFIVTDLNRYRIDKKLNAEKRSLLSIENNINDLTYFIIFLSSNRIQSVSGQVFNIDSRM